MDPTKPQRDYSLEELAQALNATLTGDGSIRIRGVSGIERAGPTDLTFISNPRYIKQLATTGAGAVLLEHGFAAVERPSLRVKDPYLAFSQAVSLFYEAPRYAPGVHPTAVVAKSAELGKNVHLGAYVVVMEDVVLGDDAVLLPHAVVYPGVKAGARLLMHAHALVRENCVLGDDVTLQPGAVVGGDGFGFARGSGGAWRKIPQSGIVVLGDSVEVQANACIDRASIGETRIGAGTKIDNLTQVGHGSTVGENTLLCAQVGLAGSTKVGDRVILAGQVGVAGHCTIGDGVVATAQSGIPGDVAAGLTVSGYPAVENRRWLKSIAALNRLPGLLRNLNMERK